MFNPYLSPEKAIDLEQRGRFFNKSLANSIHSGITVQTREIIGRNKDLKDAGLHVLQTASGEIISSIDDGVNKLDNRLSDIDMNLKEINKNIYDGFSATIAELWEVNSSLNEISNQLIYLSLSLDELVKLVKEPEQTWCQEQYYLACEALKKGFTEEAIKYVNNSIHGNDNHTGIVTEYSYHLFKARIFLGFFPEGVERTIEIDIEEGIACLERASRAAAGEAREREIRYVLAKHALAFGRFADARKFLKEAEPSSVNECITMLLILIHFDQIDDSVDIIEKAILTDVKEAMKHISIIGVSEEIISKVRLRIYSKTKNIIEDGVGAVNGAHSTLYKAVKNDIFNDKEFEKHLKKIQQLHEESMELKKEHKISKEKTILRYLKTLERIGNLRQAFSKSCQNVRNAVLANKKHDSTKTQSFFGAFGDSDGVVIVLILVVAVLFSLGVLGDVYGECREDPSSYVAPCFADALAEGISFLIMTGVPWAIGGVLLFIFGKFLLNEVSNQSNIYAGARARKHNSKLENISNFVPEDLSKLPEIKPNRK